MLDLRQFAALRAVAEHGSVLGAAAALGWSQPTVTHHLRALGLTTGLPVIDSSRAGTQLTSAGRLWLPHAIAILDRASRAEGDVAKTLADGRRRVRLGIFPTAAARVLPALVRALDSSGYSARVVEGELHELTLMWTSSHWMLPSCLSGRETPRLRDRASAAPPCLQSDSP